MNIDFAMMPSWPRLAWCAHIPHERRPTVLHGPAVETRDNWFCEGVWESEFENGGFGESDCFFGSGATLSADKLTFVSSCAPMDRLHHISVGRSHLVSNSLACLLSQANADIDPCYRTFEEEAFTITKGIREYQQTLLVNKGLVRMTICRDLHYANGSLTEMDKPKVTRRFPDFETYVSFLRSSLRNIASNMQSQARNHRYSYISGISTGYDSPAVCTLAKEAGLEEAFTFTRCRGGQDDDGSHIGAALGLRVHQLDRYAWKSMAYPEAPFIAAVGIPSGVELAAVKPLLQGRVYLTGSFGDEIWGIDTQAYKIAHFKRKEHTGLDLTEFRLHVGFINIPVPYIGYGAMEDILQISKSAALKSWDHSNTPYEPNYSRPIPRRILEEAGIPRGDFAREKKAATYGDYESNLTKRTLTNIYSLNDQNCSGCGSIKTDVGIPSPDWVPRLFRNGWRRPFKPSFLDRTFFRLVTVLSNLLMFVGSASYRGSGRIRTLGWHIGQLRSY